MRRPKEDMWKACLAVVGVLFLLVFMVWVPLSVSAYEGASANAIAGPGQVTPTIDLTITALAKEQLALQNKQLENQLQNQNNWMANNSTALIAAAASVVVALFGISQWAINRRDERRKELAAQDKELKDREDERRKEGIVQDKELRDRAEERFKAAVTALGNEKASVQVDGAILLRSFLNIEDKKIYGRYYIQIFDLAVAYLRQPSESQSTEDPGMPLSSPLASNIPLPLTPLRQALVMVFKEAFPLARNWLGEHNPKNQFDPQSLDASKVNLDNAYLREIDLEHIWMPEASLRKADLVRANLSEANLFRTDFSGAKLNGASISGANLRWTILGGTYLIGADLSGADLSGADFDKAHIHISPAPFIGELLIGAEPIEADARWTDITRVTPLRQANLRGAKGLSKSQLEVCKAKGAIIDEDTPTNSSQPAASSSEVSQSGDIQTTSDEAAQIDASSPRTDGSSSTSSQQNAEP